MRRGAARLEVRRATTYHQLIPLGWRTKEKTPLFLQGEQSPVQLTVGGSGNTKKRRTCNGRTADKDPVHVTVAR